jgi:hypothetical protein
VGAVRDRSAPAVKVVDRTMATSSFEIAVGLMLVLLTCCLLLIL